MHLLQALTRVNPTVYDSIQALCEDPHTTVVIFSGSDKGKLEETFGELDLWLAAENGVFLRPPASTAEDSDDVSPCEAVQPCVWGSGVGFRV